MLKVNVYLKYGFIEKYNIDSSLEYVICKFKNHIRTPGIPLRFNNNDYMSNEIMKVAIFEENTVFIIERNDCINPTDLKDQVKNCIGCSKQIYCDLIGVYNSCTCTEPKRLYHIENKLYHLCSKCHKERVCKSE